MEIPNPISLHQWFPMWGAGPAIGANFLYLPKSHWGKLHKFVMWI